MKILAIHSSSPELGIALTDDERVIGSAMLPPSRRHQENLTLAIQELAADLGFDLRDVDAFAAGRGPGSFSGIRVGIATAKGLAIALGKPVIGVSGLEILARQALEKDGLAAPVIDARRGEIYTAMYRKQNGDLSEIHAPVLIRADRLPSVLDPFSEPIVLCGEPVINDAATTVTPKPQTLILTPSPTICALAAFIKYNLSPKNELHTLAPLYIRRSDAEEKRGKR